MTGEKCEAIIARLFGGTKKGMAIVMDCSDTKIGKICKNEQTFSVEMIEKLLIDYKIDPDWFFRGEDGTEVRFVGESALEKKYYTAVEKLSTLQEELVGYQRREIYELKNNIAPEDDQADAQAE